MHMRIRFLTLVASVGLAACASGTTILTGMPRPPLMPEQVRLYTEAPSDFEVVGLVSASSEMGWSNQNDTNMAIAEMRKQAAKIGTNGVLIESAGPLNQGASSGLYTNSAGGIGMIAMGSSTNAAVQGKAIFVPE
jgi:hypothetical protein